MSRRGKRYKEMAARIDRSRSYPVDEAVKVLKQVADGKFDQTVELVMKLGIDTRHSDQQVRGAVGLPRGTGKKVRVVVFAEGEAARLAEEAGAVEAGGDELIKKVQEGWLDFDVAIATRSMMSKVGKLGRVLGPKGLMPSPKSGTVVEEDRVAEAVKEYLAGKVEFRADAGGNVHVPVGKLSFADEALVENITAFIEHIKRSRPSGAKGTFVQRVYLAATMSPSIRLAVA